MGRLPDPFVSNRVRYWDANVFFAHLWKSSHTRTPIPTFGQCQSPLQNRDTRKELCFRHMRIRFMKIYGNSIALSASNAK